MASVKSTLISLPRWVLWPNTWSHLGYLSFSHILHSRHQQILSDFIFKTYLSSTTPCHLHCYHPGTSHQYHLAWITALASLTEPHAYIHQEGQSQTQQPESDFTFCSAIFNGFPSHPVLFITPRTYSKVHVTSDQTSNWSPWPLCSRSVALLFFHIKLLLQDICTCCSDCKALP